MKQCIHWIVIGSLLFVGQNHRYSFCDGGFPTKGIKIFASSFATSYMVEPLLKTIGLRGMSFL